MCSTRSHTRAVRGRKAECAVGCVCVLLFYCLFLSPSPSLSVLLPFLVFFSKWIWLNHRNDNSAKKKQERERREECSRFIDLSFLFLLISLSNWGRSWKESIFFYQGWPADSISSCTAILLLLLSLTFIFDLLVDPSSFMVNRWDVHVHQSSFAFINHWSFSLWQCDRCSSWRMSILNNVQMYKFSLVRPDRHELLV